MQRVNINGVTCSIIFIRPAFKYQLQRAFLLSSHVDYKIKQRERKKNRLNWLKHRESQRNFH